MTLRPDGYPVTVPETYTEPTAIGRLRHSLADHIETLRRDGAMTIRFGYKDVRLRTLLDVARWLDEFEAELRDGEGTLRRWS